MNMKNALKLFEDNKVRTVWDDEQEKWYVSIVDVVGILTESPNPNNYWKVLKNRLKKEGNQSVTNCNQLKMQSADGKFYKSERCFLRNKRLTYFFPLFYPDPVWCQIHP